MQVFLAFYGLNNLFKIPFFASRISVVDFIQSQPFSGGNNLQ